MAQRSRGRVGHTHPLMISKGRAPASGRARSPLLRTASERPKSAGPQAAEPHGGPRLTPHRPHTD
jgi:hypothetical protein